MRREIRLWGLFFVILFISSGAQIGNAQDEFFTSFRTVPLTLNPAEAGRISVQGRLTTLARTQWNTISGRPYRAAYAGLEMQAFCLGENFFGGSLSAAMEQSGTSRFQRLNAQAGLSYHQKLAPALYLSGGVEMGVLQHRLGRTDLRFDAQFDGTEYIPNRSNGEALLSLSQMQMDASAGILLYEQTGKWSVGMSVDHLFSPSLSFLEDNGYTVGLGLVVHGQIQVNGWVSDKRPAIITGLQAVYRQYELFGAQQWHSIIGGYGVIRMGPSKRGPITSYVKFDMSLRLAGQDNGAPILGDAFLITTSFVQEGWQYGVTYDATLSSQNRVNGGFGGLELFISIPISGQRTCVLCPSF